MEGARTRHGGFPPLSAPQGEGITRGEGREVSGKEKVRSMHQVITHLTPVDRGRFWTWKGREHPW